MVAKNCTTQSSDPAHCRMHEVCQEEKENYGNKTQNNLSRNQNAKDATNHLHTVLYDPDGV